VVEMIQSNYTRRYNTIIAFYLALYNFVFLPLLSRRKCEIKLSQSVSHWRIKVLEE